VGVERRERGGRRERARGGMVEKEKKSMTCGLHGLVVDIEDGYRV